MRPACLSVRGRGECLCRASEAARLRVRVCVRQGILGICVAPCVSVVVICVHLPVCTPQTVLGVGATLCVPLCVCVRCSSSQPSRQSPLCPSPYSWGSRFLSLACPSWGPGRGAVACLPALEDLGRAAYVIGGAPLSIIWRAGGQAPGVFGSLPRPPERAGLGGSPGGSTRAFPERCSATHRGLHGSSRTGAGGPGPERGHQLPKVTQLTDGFGI